MLKFKNEQNSQKIKFSKQVLSSSYEVQNQEPQEIIFRHEMDKFFLEM